MKEQMLGFIGLGAMGGRMARNLVRAGCRLIGYDIRDEAVAACVEAGAEAGRSSEDVVQRSDVVMTSLVGHVYIQVAEQVLVPNARSGQIFVDFSTVAAPRTRRIAGALAARGAVALDVPVSGWITGAESGTLSMFVGGDEAAVRECRELFEVLGDPDRIIYGGPAGTGQVMKAVQQMKNRLPDAARLEVMAFGRRAGLAWEQVLHVLGVDPRGDDGYAKLYRRIRCGQSEQLGCLFPEWAYYLAEAREKGIPMPILESLRAFCDPGERVSQDQMGRPTPSVWRELMTREGPALAWN
jgi:3-hydroxyisobutyrate dehydrogenase